ncbi:MAG: Na+/H+ antiporter NhaC family protein [Planctomycetota bacterium]
MAQTARISPPRRNLRAFLTLGIAIATLLAFARAPQAPQGDVTTGESAFSVSVVGERTPVTGAPIDLVVTHRDRNGDPTSDFDWFGGGVTICGLRDLEDRPLDAPVAIAADPGGRRTTTMQVDAEGRLEVRRALLDGPLEFALAGRRPGGIPSPVPGWMALAPAILAILLAILFRQVYIALFAGIWIGGWAIADGAWAGFKLAVTDIIPGALAQRDKISIIVFSTLLGGVVAMVARMGGTRALVEMVASRGESRRGAMFSTWIAGVMIFFDDYANALLVGNTMRPVTDRFRVSREKLAFLVDSTSAPVACIFIISTWIATEINYIQDRLASEVVRNATGFAADGGYDVFLQTIPFNFYPIFCLFFGLMICITGRDYGPMLRAERRAAIEGKLVRDGAVPLSSKEMDELEPVDASRTYWWNAALPVLTIVASVLGFLWATGGASIAADADVVRHEIRVVERGLADAKAAAAPDAAAIDALAADLATKRETLGELDAPGLRDVFGASDSYYALLMAAFLGVIVALVLAVGQRLMKLERRSRPSPPA